VVWDVFFCQFLKHIRIPNDQSCNTQQAL
jgi:hypothetical protein